MSGYTYKDSGVDIGAADQALAAMKEAILRTHSGSVVKTLSDFGGLFSLGTGYHEPVLVAGTDGVGTKLKIAFLADRHDTIGQDLVAMCVDDVVVQGARPLFFLDYLAVGRLEPKKAAEIVRGIAVACEMAGCALIGGETAEMPGFYPDGEYDLSGFAVGVVEREQIIDGSAVQAGDVLLGLASSGLHSNGYSLVRKVLLDVHNLPLDKPAGALTRALGDELLEPTRIYAPHIVAALDKGLRPHGMAHITGGGWPGNISRIVPSNLRAKTERDAVPVPPVFSLIAELGPVSSDEMYKTFNMGVGMVLVTAPEMAEAHADHYRQCGIDVYEMGKIVPQ